LAAGGGILNVSDLLNVDLPKNEAEALAELTTGAVLRDKENADTLENLIRLGLAEKYETTADGWFAHGAKINEAGKNYLFIRDVQTEVNRKEKRRSFWRDFLFLLIGGAVGWCFDHLAEIVALFRFGR
jgi:hypothetical protein